MLDRRHRQIACRVLAEIVDRIRLDPRRVREQLLREWHILRRPVGLHQHEEHRVIARYVVAAGCVDVESAARRLEFADENRDQVERVVLHELLERECLWRLEQRPIARDGLSNAGVGELHCHFVQLVRRQEEERFRQNDLDEVERIGNLVRDIFDSTILAISVGDTLDQRFILMHVASARKVDDHDVIVDRAHVAQHFSEIVDLFVFLRNEIEKIRIECQPRAGDDRGERDDNRGEDDLFASAKAEFCEAVEDAVNQSVGG